MPARMIGAPTIASPRNGCLRGWNAGPTLPDQGDRGRNTLDLFNVSLGCQEDYSQDCTLQHSFLSSWLVPCNYRRRERWTLAAMQVWAGRYPSSRRSPHLDPGNGHSSQAKQDRGLCAPASRKSSCVAVLWVTSGTQPVFLPRSGTRGLLAILRYLVRRVGAANFRGRIRLVRRDIRCSLGAHDNASRSRTRACFCPSSPGNNLRRNRTQVTKRSWLSRFIATS